MFTYALSYYHNILHSVSTRYQYWRKCDVAGAVVGQVATEHAYLLSRLLTVNESRLRHPRIAHPPRLPIQRFHRRPVVTRSTTATRVVTSDPFSPTPPQQQSTGYFYPP
jgi:hypothetical protein